MTKSSISHQLRNCAAKIERDINKLDGVSSAAVDFVSKTLTMELADHTLENSLT